MIDVNKIEKLQREYQMCLDSIKTVQKSIKVEQDKEDTLYETLSHIKSELDASLLPIAPKQSWYGND